MKTILTDVDDCILQFSDPMQAFLETKGYVIQERMRDHHNIPGLFNIDLPTTLELVREFHRSAAFGELEAEPCAKEVLPALYEQGYRFVAITACLNEPGIEDMRRANLKKVFGFDFEAVHCVGLKNDKKPELSGFSPAIWVEDTFHHAVAGAEVGHWSFVVDRLYNRSHSHPGVTRVTDWHEIAAQLSASAHTADCS